MKIAIDLFTDPSDEAMKLIKEIEENRFVVRNFDNSVEDANLRAEMKEIVEAVGGSMFIHDLAGDYLCCFVVES